MQISLELNPSCINFITTWVFVEVDIQSWQLTQQALEELGLQSQQQYSILQVRITFNIQ